MNPPSQHAWRLRVVRVAFVLVLGATAALAPLSAVVVPSRLRAALDCLLSKDYVMDAMRELGLKPGDRAWVRYYVGSIPGGGETPGEYYIAVYSPDGNRAWLLIAFPDRQARFVPVNNGYRLRKIGRNWQADEGNGGLASYRTMSQFAGWLARHRRRYRIALNACPRLCSRSAT